MRTLSIMTATLLLSGCVTTNSELAQRVVIRCATVVGFNKADQQRALAELKALPPGSVIGEKLLPDYVRMREEARACANQTIN